MAVTVTVQGNQMKVVDGTKIRYENTDDVSININENADTVSLFNNHTGKEIVNSDRADYTPSGADAEAVADAIAELM